MKRVILSFLVLCAVCGASAAQQPNGFAASLIVNGFMGPPYPVAGVSLPIGLPATVSIGASTPNVPYLLFGASDLVAGPGTPVPGVGLIDIDLASGPFVILDGFATPGVTVGPTGAAVLAFPIALGTPLGTPVAAQALISDPGATTGLALSAAVGASVTPGLSVITLTPPTNGGALFSLAGFGLSFPFYGATYTEMFVNTDGNITFGSASSDFTPTPAELEFAQPRIAPLWTDLNLPAPGATVTVTVNQALPTPFPTVTVAWTALPDSVGVPHTISAVLTIPTGDITLLHAPGNVGPLSASIVGISPGMGIVPATTGVFPAATNMNALPTAPLLALPGAAIWEAFGSPAVVIVPPVGNPYDLAGTVLNCLAIAPGTPAAQFYAN